jgi:hypothetical protein
VGPFQSDTAEFLGQLFCFGSRPEQRLHHSGPMRHLRVVVVPFWLDQVQDTNILAKINSKDFQIAWAQNTLESQTNR